MPDSMETSHTDWVGRKHAKLKRSTLDCGHANTGDVHYHYWCDRLSCSEECANAGHDCGLFKGKGGIEAEAVEPEAVVDPPAPRPLTLSPETYMALYGQDVAVVSMPATTMVHYELHQPEGAAPLVAEIEAPEPVVAAPDRYMTDEHMAQIRAVSVEDFRAESLDESPPDPVRIRRRSPEGRRAYLAAERARLVARGASADWLSAFDELAADAAALDELEQHPARPWWRRMLPGGTR